MQSFISTWEKYPFLEKVMLPFGRRLGGLTSSCLLCHSKTSFEKNCFSAWASTLNMGLINKVDMVCCVACGIWCLADDSSVSPSSEQTGELWANQCLNSW